MSLIVLGTNHKSAALERRERWTYGIEEIPITLENLKTKLQANDVVLLSTCNRTEIYCDIAEPERLINWFNVEVKPSTDLDITRDGYFYEDKEAVAHIMRVASGLDSLVVGEPQILGQFKQAYRLAKKANTVSKKFDKLFTQAISAAKTVRTYTDIGSQPVSVASASVALLIKNLLALENNNTNHTLGLKILLLGSGDTIKTIGKTLLAKLEKIVNIGKNIDSITIASRNTLHASDLAIELSNYHALNPVNFVNFANFAIENFDIINNPEALGQYDIIFTATRSPVFILTYNIIEAISRAKLLQNKKLFLIDLAVPRDIDPKCQGLANISLFTVDDLQSTIERNTTKRKKAVRYAENIILQHTKEFYDWEKSLLALSSICSYRQQAEEMCSDVIEKAKRKLESGQDPEEVLIHALYLLRNKLLHHPTMTLKSLVQEQKMPEVELLKDFLNL
ncbi:MAG: glutamyl-tRNA reductase [Gammaproteobacteria bacterium]|nr:glutamyl-tRNA reductase [Gammaproteobacteria bacterium]